MSYLNRRYISFSDIDIDSLFYNYVFSREKECVCERERERVRDAAELTTRYNILAQGTIRKRKEPF
jgi:hypothetical protein